MRRVFVLLVAFGLTAPLVAELRVILVDGEADYRGVNATTWRPLVEGEVLPEVGYLRTGPQSFLELRRDTRATIIISANTLAKVHFDEGDRRDRLLVHVGAVLTKILALGTPMQIVTITTVLGVRGTEFTVLADPREGSHLAVKEGRVFALSRTLGEGGLGGVLVEAGFKAVSSPGVAPRAVPLQPADEDYYDFPAFGQTRPRLFDHWSRQDDALFRDFTTRDLSDLQLFLIDDMDQQWQYLLSQNQEFADQLFTEPLSSHQ